MKLSNNKPDQKLNIHLLAYLCESVFNQARRKKIASMLATNNMEHNENLDNGNRKEICT